MYLYEEDIGSDGEKPLSKVAGQNQQSQELLHYGIVKGSDIQLATKLFIYLNFLLKQLIIY
jgi:hypothetical protein